MVDRRVNIVFISLFTTFFVVTNVGSEGVVPKYEKGNKRNPFIPIVTNDGQLINIEEENEEAQFKLEGIIYDQDGQSMAIINGQILRKNETILDAKVVEIRKDSVVYVKDGEIFVLDTEKKEER
jgi:type II secretory pathway component PulC